MTFEYETSPTRVWTRMHAEHDLLEQAIASGSHEGDVDYLNHRVVDLQRGIAMYYVDAIGKSEGKQFALVYGQDIVGIEAEHLLSRATDQGDVLKVYCVSIPMEMNDRREVIAQWIMEALTFYVRAHSAILPRTTEISLNCEEIWWRIRSEDSCLP